jgi:hypothetical protein
MYSLPYGSPQRRINNDLKKKKTLPEKKHRYKLEEDGLHS